MLNFVIKNFFFFFPFSSRFFVPPQLSLSFFLCLSLFQIATMPELPEVESARQTAEEHLVDKTIVGVNAVEDESEFFSFLGGA